ncbi:hypothetical protein FKR81_24625 [Lentzea tibetensis]|uniref:Uncharacterized protein n=1 Tax=Lentzea tibetensis TaxID=2591470 RepID=A0A563EPW4_9PSEU|nr:hypothetical protein [Lentzea tibetensis]TWP49299.1 hypothetical protein FKR81_24625 [Lentzea tibetensis]
MLAPAGDLVNDVFVTDDAAYVTNSDRPEIYRLPLRGGKLPTQGQVQKIPLTGDIVFGTGVTTALDLGGLGRRPAQGRQHAPRRAEPAEHDRRAQAQPRRDAATVVRKITDPSFDVPTNVVLHRDRLWLPNARLTTPQTPETPYGVVSVPRPGW